MPSDLRKDLEERVDNQKLEKPTLAHLKVVAECVQYGRNVNPDSLGYKRKLEYYKKNTGVNA